MPKITGQAVPAELLALYTAITSPAKVTQGADGVLKLRKNKRKPKRRTRENLDLIALQKTARRVALLLGYTDGSQAYKDFLFTLTRELMFGIFDLAYFRPCDIRHAMTFVSTVTSVVDPTPPPYSYRLPDQRPTIPTYSSGLPTSMEPGYEGFLVGVDYKDSYLRWRKISFDSPYLQDVRAQENVLVRWNCRIDIKASKRGSRPMLSLNLKMQTCREFDSALDTYEPPIVKKTSFYWRFKMPPSDAPYFNTYQVRSVVKGGARIHQSSGTGNRVAFLLNASNRPMMGRGFNNNQLVQTNFTGDPEMWEIKPCLGALSRPIWKGSDDVHYLVNILTGELYPTLLPVSHQVQLAMQDKVLTTDFYNNWWIEDHLLNTRYAFTFPNNGGYGFIGAYRYNGFFYCSFLGPSTHERNVWRVNPKAPPTLITAGPPWGPPRVLWPDAPFLGAPGHSSGGWYPVGTMPYFVDDESGGTSFNIQWWNPTTRAYIPLGDFQFWSIIGCCDSGVFIKYQNEQVGFTPYTSGGGGISPGFSFGWVIQTLRQWCVISTGLYVRRWDGKFGIYSPSGRFTETPPVLTAGALLQHAVCPGAD